MKVFLHSDDVCLTASSTKKILTCWSNGYLDGFSILANQQHLSTVKSLIDVEKNRTLRVSAHLNLTDLRSILPATEIPLLVTENGRFKISFAKALLITVIGGQRKKDFVSQVYNEWEAQLNLIINDLEVKNVIGVDSHNHIHMIPSLFKITSDLALKHNLAWIRVPNEPFFIVRLKDIFHLFYIRNILKYLLIKILVFLSGADKSIKAQRAMGVLYSGHMFKANVMKGLKAAKRKGATSIEVIFHVGRSNKDELVNNVFSQTAFNFFSHENRDIEFNTVNQMRHEK